MGGALVPQVAPSSKLYWILNPGTAGGSVTTIGPQPLLTVGAEGAAGKITMLSILLVLHEPVPVLPSGVLPQASAKTY